jgi:RNA polymerase sigma-70 factor (ECF subfamily)
MPPPGAEVPPRSSESAEALPEDLEAIYAQHFDFVWRNARRLGVPEHALDDVVQDVFVIVCRRLTSFEARSSVATWLYGILVNVVNRHRRTHQRRAAKLPPAGPTDFDDVPALGVPSPADVTAEREAAELLYTLLASLDEDKRQAFILIALEQRSPLELAEATGVNVNTIHSRVRAARLHIEQGILRHRARDNWRLP